MQRFLASRTVIVICAVLLLAAFAIAFTPSASLKGASCCKRKVVVPGAVQKIYFKGQPDPNCPHVQRMRALEEMTGLQRTAANFRANLQTIAGMCTGPTIPPIEIDCHCPEDCIV